MVTPQRSDQVAGLPQDIPLTFSCQRLQQQPHHWPQLKQLKRHIKRIPRWWLIATSTSAQSPLNGSSRFPGRPSPPTCPAASTRELIAAAAGKDRHQDYQTCSRITCTHTSPMPHHRTTIHSALSLMMATHYPLSVLNVENAVLTAYHLGSRPGMSSYAQPCPCIPHLVPDLLAYQDQI